MGENVNNIRRRPQSNSTNILSKRPTKGEPESQRRNNCPSHVVWADLGVERVDNELHQKGRGESFL
jgi:hypothetical protein